MIKILTNLINIIQNFVQKCFKVLFLSKVLKIFSKYEKGFRIC